jgi:hypothetical protein
LHHAAVIAHGGTGTRSKPRCAGPPLSSGDRVQQSGEVSKSSWAYPWKMKFQNSTKSRS